MSLRVLPIDKFFSDRRLASITIVNFFLSLPRSMIVIYSSCSGVSDLLRYDFEKYLKVCELDIDGKKIKLADLKGKYGERQLQLESPYEKGVYSDIYFCWGIPEQNQGKFDLDKVYKKGFEGVLVIKYKNNIDDLDDYIVIQKYKKSNAKSSENLNIACKEKKKETVK